MAENYKIGNTGTQVVKAPNQIKPARGTKVVKTGDDLRK